MQNNSCLGCGERRLGCHDSCGKYQARKAARESRRELERRRATADGYMRDACEKNRRRK